MYIDKHEELKEGQDAKKWLQACASGNKDAEAFLFAFYNFEQMFDDLLDKDKDASHEEIIQALIDFIATISFNAFYNQYKQILFSFMVSMADRNLSGDEMVKKEETRIAGYVVRKGAIELVLMVAFLTGGWEHMRKLKHIRSYTD